MPLYQKESIDLLRQRIDLIDVLSPYVELKRAGAVYKALCPFHDEKTPSFTINRGASHYHCFGCGVHGDAIHFLMNHQKMNFVEAIESLGQRFNVPLQIVEDGEHQKGPSKEPLKQALEHAAQFFHFYLLHTDEGQVALHYLYDRGIDLDFIRQFKLGFAPKSWGVFRKMMHLKFVKDEALIGAGLLTESKREFFLDRITIPIYGPTGGVIGFTARKYKEETYGGKYINTPETPLFKKSRILFGLNYCRRRIAKERRAIIVEGQLDALRLIYSGFNITVAGQGTAFGEAHVKELINLGVNVVYLALDPDHAGQEATFKIGNMFQKDGVEVFVVPLPIGCDPDAFIREKGPEAFQLLLSQGIDYLTYLVNYQTKHLNMESPAAKSELVMQIAKQIRQWGNDVMVHESLRKLAHLTQVPEHLIGVGVELMPANVFVQQSGNVGLQVIDPHRVLEGDFVLWLLLCGQSDPVFISIAENNIRMDNLKSQPCRMIYQSILKVVNGECREEMKPEGDVEVNSDEGLDNKILVCNASENKHHRLNALAVMGEVDDNEVRLFMSDLMLKRLNKAQAKERFVEVVQAILNRDWMEKREAVRLKLSSGQCSDEQATLLAKEFDELRKSQPKVKFII